MSTFADITVSVDGFVTGHLSQRGETEESVLADISFN